jgi:hypothetical protein
MRRLAGQVLPPRPPSPSNGAFQGQIHAIRRVLWAGLHCTARNCARHLDIFCRDCAQTHTRARARAASRLFLHARACVCVVGARPNCIKVADHFTRCQHAHAAARHCRPIFQFCVLDPTVGASQITHARTPTPTLPLKQTPSSTRQHHPHTTHHTPPPTPPTGAPT